jgi:hypothetical protein
LEPTAIHARVARGVVLRRLAQSALN